MRTAGPWIALAALALIVRLPGPLGPPPDRTAGGYPDLVFAVAEGQGLTFSASGGPVPAGQPTILYPPAYPAGAGTLLRLAGPGWVFALQLAALACTACLWFALARTLLRRSGPALAFAALATLDPGTWRAASWFEPTVAFQLTLVTLLLAAVHWRRRARLRTGLALLATCLLLPLLRSGLLEYVLLLSLLAAAWHWRRPERAGRPWLALAFPLAVVLLVAVWGSWNTARVGRFKLTSSSGIASVCAGPPLDDRHAPPSQRPWRDPHPDPVCRCEAPCDEAAWDSELRAVWVQDATADPAGAVGRALRGVAQTVLPVHLHGTVSAVSGLALAAVLATAAVLAWRRQPAAAAVSLLVLHVLALGLFFPPTAERAAIVRPALMLPLWLLVFRARSRP